MGSTVLALAATCGRRLAIGERAQRNESTSETAAEQRRQHHQPHSQKQSKRARNDDDYENDHYLITGAHESGTQRGAPLIRLSAPNKRRRHFSGRSISLACISYIIFNQMFMTALISSSGIANLTGGANSSDSGDQQGARLAHGQHARAQRPHAHAHHLHRLASFERPLVGLVAASPAPEPSPAALARSATSQRMPPMNGSIFGKRDLASARARTAAAKSARRDYNEIITNVIEDFMAHNNEVDPHKTTIAFCRMIIYECHQVLASARGLSRAAAAASHA